MKKLRYFLIPVLAWVAFFSMPVLQTGCSTTSQPQAVQTLKIVGVTAKTGLDACTQLLKQGTITVAQYQKVADFYDNRYAPAYALALTAARSDLSSVASPDLLLVAAQFAALVDQYTTPTNH